MDAETTERIKTEIIPIINSGDATLLLGAGFSINNSTNLGVIPDGKQLTRLILDKANVVEDDSASLQDAHEYGKNTIEKYDIFLKETFTATSSLAWQNGIFNYCWNSIFTTNIDNVLRLAYDNVKRAGKNSAEFKEYNYTDPSPISTLVSSIPVIYLHGKVDRLEDGIVFDDLEYASNNAKKLDWISGISARLLGGKCIVVGNRLRENDILLGLETRRQVYLKSDTKPNWIILRTVSPIQKSNLERRGFNVIEAEAADFFNFILANLRPRNLLDIMEDKYPVIKAQHTDKLSMFWFKNAFSPVISSIETGANSNGILNHFIRGDEPDWYYISNDGYANLGSIREIENEITRNLNTQGPCGVIHLIGNSASGKTTGLRAALKSIIRNFPYAYEFKMESAIEVDYLYRIIKNFSERAILIFYDANEYYYVVNEICKRLLGDERKKVLFILEAREKNYLLNRRHLVSTSGVESEINWDLLTLNEAKSLAEKMDSLGIIVEDFSDKSIDQRAKIIVDNETGFNGDLLATLFTLIGSLRLEELISDEFNSIQDEESRTITKIVAILNSLGFHVPTQYVSGISDISAADIDKKIEKELKGIVQYADASTSLLRCRHKVIAEYYFQHCITENETPEIFISILWYLSKQFDVSQIKNHPISYRMYKKLISCKFLLYKAFPPELASSYTHKVYNEAQKYYGGDAIFWLQFGMYYKACKNFVNAIDCLRTGLGIYNSFQIRHNLGDTLLKKYAYDSTPIDSEFDEGLGYLESEIQQRSSDPYPLSTLCAALLRINQNHPGIAKVEKYLAQYINRAYKSFSQDEVIQRLFKQFATKQFIENDDLDNKEALDRFNPENI